MLICARAGKSDGQAAVCSMLPGVAAADGGVLMLMIYLHIMCMCTATHSLGMEQRVYVLKN
jgi:hypothetical protein